MSSNGAFAGKIRFAGYGISAQNRTGTTSTASMSKARLPGALRGIPDGKIPSSAARFRMPDLRYKAWNLREHGAKAVLFVDPKMTTYPS